jgi:hypothetical protein
VCVFGARTRARARVCVFGGARVRMYARASVNLCAWTCVVLCCIVSCCVAFSVVACLYVCACVRAFGFACPSIYPSVRLSAQPSSCWFVLLSVCRSVYISAGFLSAPLSAREVCVCCEAGVRCMIARLFARQLYIACNVCIVRCMADACNVCVVRCMVDVRCTFA